MTVQNALAKLKESGFTLATPGDPLRTRPLVFTRGRALIRFYHDGRAVDDDSIVCWRCFDPSATRAEQLRGRSLASSITSALRYVDSPATPTTATAPGKRTATGPRRNTVSTQKVRVQADDTTIRIRFPSKPDDDLRNSLREAGFRYDKEKYYWNGSRTPQTVSLAKQIVTAQ